MRLLIEKLRSNVTVRSLVATWTSLRVTLRRIAAHERQALGGHIDAAHARATAARQAGDATTLVRDQIDLLPESQARLHENVTTLRAIIGDLLADWLSIWRDWRRRRKDAERS